MKYKYTFMEVAETWAKHSYCKRLKVGAVIVRDSRIVSTGFNGTISGHENCCEKLHKFASKEEFESTPEENKHECPQCSKGHWIQTYKCDKCDDYGYLRYEDKTNDFTLHAEANAILWAAKTGTTLEGTSLFVTHTPCKECAKLIAQAGIKEVFYKNEYKQTDSIKFLQACNIAVTKLD